MPPSTVAARTRTVETTTKEEIPITEKESQGLGAPWDIYMRSIAQDELEITEVKFYRIEPRILEGYVLRVYGERVDEDWIADRLGGGVFNVRIWSKSGKSHLERNVKVPGAPKLTDAERASNPGATIASSAAPDTPANGTLLTLLDKMMDRMEKMQERFEARPVSAGSAAETSGIDVVANAAKRGFELITTAMPQPPAKETDELDRAFRKAMIDRLLAPPAAPVESDFDKQLKKVMMDRLLAPPPTESKSLLEQLKGLAELRDLMGWSEGGKSEHWTTALVNGVVAKAPELFDKLGEHNAARLEMERTKLRTAETIARARGNQPPAAAAPQTPPVQTSANGGQRVPPPPQAPPAGPLRMAPLDGSGEAPAGSPAADTAGAGEVDTESPVFIAFVKRRVVDLFNAGEPGGAIVSFLVGNQQHQFVKLLVDNSAEQVIAFLRRDPILKAIADDPDFPQALEEARQYVLEAQRDAAAVPIQ